MWYDSIYSFSSKGFSCAYGEYRLPITSDGKTSLHKWNSKSVSGSVYNKKFKKAFDSSNAKSFESISFKSKSTILKKLK